MFYLKAGRQFNLIFQPVLHETWFASVCEIHTGTLRKRGALG